MEMGFWISILHFNTTSKHALVFYWPITQSILLLSSLPSVLKILSVGTSSHNEFLVETDTL